MSSNINTDSIDVNYPVPGVNNSSQGFRDNFSSIRTNLDTAANEITDLQNKVVVKQPLNGTVVNNDMANTLISNALIRSFRATTYNVGDNLSGIVNINVSLGDVQYLTISANTTLTFSNWSPSRTQSNVQLLMTFANTDAYVTFPTKVAYNSNSGADTLENSSVNTVGQLVVGVFDDITQLNYMLSTIDCGDTVYIDPTNRPRKSTAAKIQNRTPSPKGLPGDYINDVCVDSNYIYVCTDNYNAVSKSITVNQLSFDGNIILLSPTISNIGSVNDPIIFSQGGTSIPFGGIIANVPYYVKSIDSPNNIITLSETISGGVAGPVFLPELPNTYDITVNDTNINGDITVSPGTLGNVSINNPIIFNQSFGGIIAGSTYYVKTFNSPNITVSTTVAGPTFLPTSTLSGLSENGNIYTILSSTGTINATTYNGTDIWKRTPLNTF